MKKIVLFIASLQKGGSERVMANLAADLKTKGYDVVLVTQYLGIHEYELASGIRRVLSEPSEEELTQNRIRNFCKRFQRLRSVFKEENPDVVLAFLGKNNLMAILTTRFLPCKVAVSVRGEPTMEYPSKMMQILAKFLFHLADGVIFQTSDASGFFPKAVRKKSRILPNPLNEQFLQMVVEEDDMDTHRNKVPIWDKVEDTKERGRISAFEESEKHPFLVITAGRLDENKNQELLLRAFAQVKERKLPARLLLYGDGPLKNELQMLAETLGIASDVTFAGSVSDLPIRMRQADLFVLPSNTEGMPNALLEAMATGLAVISTDCPCGGPRELIQNEKNGLLVPVKDVTAMADAISRVLQDGTLRENLARNAKQSAGQYAPELVNALWEEFLNSL